MSSFNKLEYELYALLVINKFLPDLVPLKGTLKGESPDWQNYSSDFGIEVVRAESKADGDAKAFSNEYLGKPVNTIPKKRLKKHEKRITVSQEQTLSSVEMYSFYGRLESDDPRADSFFAKPVVDRCENKLKLLNGNYSKFRRNILCVYLPFSMGKDEARIMYKCYIIRASQYNAIFTDLFFIGISSIIYIDGNKWIYYCDDFCAKKRTSIDQLVHTISALPVCDEGKMLFDELKKYGIDLDEENEPISFSERYTLYDLTKRSYK
ncbi:MAG: hypothetical protein K6F68_05325 [Clostridiales bacterium]|nr:hypothetical protein [Clostridiales bacterium]